MRRGWTRPWSVSKGDILSVLLQRLLSTRMASRQPSEGQFHNGQDSVVSRGGRGGGVALGKLPGTSEPVSPQVLAWKGSGGQTRRLQSPQAPRKAVNPTAAGGPGCSVHAVSLLCPSTLSRRQGNAYRTLVGTECSSEVHGAQERPSRPGGRPQAGLCPGLSTGTGGGPQGSLRAPPPALILLASVLCPVRWTPPLSRHRPWGTLLCSFGRWGEH